MGKIQAYNKRIGAWVMGKIVTNNKGGSYFKVLNVKQKEKEKPFVGVKKVRRE
jgi:2-succinyl-5-enolpyruvyl-6-hydroxy-3-cyclohexene-1-carboxylate synthase